MSEERAHSTVGASSAKRWMACPGSVALHELAGDSPSSEYADEGTAAHELAERCLMLNENPETFAGETIQGGEREFTINEDMIEAVQVYVDHIHSVIVKSKNPQMGLEFHVDLEWLRPGMFGTADCIIVAGSTLHVIDYKHGKGHVVEVKGNVQMRYYGLGPADQIEGIERVILTIVQPRAYHVDGPIRSDEISVNDLLNWATCKLGPAVDHTRELNAPRVAGDHCHWCPGLALCDKAKEKAQDDARLDFTDLEASPYVEAELKVTTIEELSQILAAKGFVTNYLAAVESEVKSRLLKGDEVPGWKMIEGKANRKWKDEKGALKYLQANNISEEIMYKRAFMSPAQAEKALQKQIKDKEGRKEAKEKLGTFWVKPVGNPRLVSEDQKGEALDLGKAPVVPKGEFTVVE